MTNCSFHPTTTGLRPMALPLMILILATCSCAPSPETTGTSSEPGETEASTSAGTPPVGMPQVLLPDGFEVTLELAITPEELSQGLMFRPRLPEDRGMLLIFAEERLPSIWMMNTLVALDPRFAFGTHPDERFAFDELTITLDQVETFVDFSAAVTIDDLRTALRQDRDAFVPYAHAALSAYTDVDAGS